ncbi:MAG: hypothetical protein AAGF01_04275 [Cyanobacteria bacterium P01_G01_bin.38]
MNRTFLYTLSGAVCLGALMSTSNLAMSPFRELETTAVLAQTASSVSPPSVLSEMTLDRLEAILQAETNDLEGERGQWQITLEDQSVLVLADATSNRMRIVAPIVEANTLSAEQVQAMLVANFHSALDARYAVTNGAVVAVFVHPLSSLQENDFRSGLRQVASLANTFGTSYSSGELGFLPNRAPQEPVPARGDNLEI